ncbi:MAG: type II toxin-antitoxin system PemK/MazF family toxin [Bdellovibrionales bacterium]
MNAGKTPQIYQRWDVVVVPYPLTNDGMGGRRRPALVVCREDLPRDYGLYWLLMITAASHTGQNADVAIDDWEAANLPSAAVIRTTKIITVSQHQILRKLGTLAPGDQMRATLELSRFIG